MAKTKVNLLHDTQVNEVSYVDKGAIGQKFYFMKRDTSAEPETQIPEKQTTIQKIISSITKSFKGKVEKSDGFTDFTAAISYEVNNDKLWDAYWAIRDVIFNIIGDENITDKSFAIGNACDQFKNYVISLVSQFTVAKRQEIVKKYQEENTTVDDAFGVFIEDLVNISKSSQTPETDIGSAVLNFKNQMTSVLSDNVQKAGKKVSSARLDTLKVLSSQLNDFIADAESVPADTGDGSGEGVSKNDNGKGEDNEMKPEDLTAVLKGVLEPLSQKMDEVTKRLEDVEKKKTEESPSAGATTETVVKTAEPVQKTEAELITEAIQKAMEPLTTKIEEVTKRLETVEKMEANPPAAATGSEGTPDPVTKSGKKWPSFSA